jgi:hypothetical protein
MSFPTYPLAPFILHKKSFKAVLTAMVLVAGIGTATAQQGGNRQIQVLPAPGGDQSAPANATPANEPLPPPAANAAPEPAPAPPPADAAAAPPPDAPPIVGAIPGKGKPEKGAPVFVEKPVKPFVKPKPRYHEREYGYQPRYERGYGGGGYGGGSYGGGGGYGGGYGGSRY